MQCALTIQKRHSGCWKVYLHLLGRAQPVIPPNLYSIMNIKAWGPQENLHLLPIPPYNTGPLARVTKNAQFRETPVGNHMSCTAVSTLQTAAGMISGVKCISMSINVTNSSRHDKWSQVYQYEYQRYKQQQA